MILIEKLNKKKMLMNIDKDSRNKAVNVNEDKKSQISSKSKTSKNTSSRRK